VAIDVKRANPGSTTDPILVRVRNLYGMCEGTSLTIDIESNAAYTATTNTGSAGTVDTGYAASNLGWKFPVTTDAHSASTNGLFVLNTGNVGIGTTVPEVKADIVASSDTTALRLRQSNVPTTSYFTWKVDNAVNGALSLYGYVSGVESLGLTQMRDGTVGIGTTSPQSRLQVVDAIKVSDVATQQLGKLVFGNGGSTIEQVGMFRGAADGTYTANNTLNLGGYESINFNTGYAALGSQSVRMTILNGGNVGIGKTTPAYPLDVEGAIHASGAITGATINATYQDVAEWVATSKDVPVATVVVLDPNHSNQVTTSFKGYDTRVAGVVSAKPGLVLGEGGAGKAMIATVGRVKVKVDATRQPIHVGDLLVTGTLEGTAMKSEPVNIGGVEMHRPGTLIGKALEPLEKGTGEILVLLSLQ
jgi:hypothetical protein